MKTDALIPLYLTREEGEQIVDVLRWCMNEGAVIGKLYTNIVEQLDGDNPYGDDSIGSRYVR